MLVVVVVVAVVVVDVSVGVVVGVVVVVCGLRHTHDTDTDHADIGHATGCDGMYIYISIYIDIYKSLLECQARLRGCRIRGRDTAVAKERRAVAAVAKNKRAIARATVVPFTFPPPKIDRPHVLVVSVWVVLCMA